MSDEPAELREVVERNAEAVMAGNFAQLMADITPDALAKLMQMAPQGTQPALTSLPAITGYDVQWIGAVGDGHQYRATFVSAAGTADIVATWKLVLGQWRIVEFNEVTVTPGVAATEP